ncbi:hypothetical protein niasHT_007955 [Heterodera trifolii]|uniref:Uncharacterized protein n=1 Tax=Heterodera trifolii TaxID=157864 RepID=A0ABD2LZJ4_9BILA
MESEGEGAICQTLSDLSDLLDKFDGRDKTIRSLHFALVLVANRFRDRRKSDRLMAFAKQLSRTRLICRLFSQPSLLLSVLRIPRAFRLSRDRVDCALASSVSVLYLFCGWNELISLLAESGLVGRAKANILKFHGNALHLWVLALAFCIFRCLRQIALRLMPKANALARHQHNDRQWLRSQFISLIGFSADFVAAVNLLPRGSFWAGKLSPSQSAALHLTASVIGMFKQIQLIKK